MEHGDWATNAALQPSAKKVGKNPREAAALLAEKISAISCCIRRYCWPRLPLNITLDAAAAGELAAIVEAGEDNGRSDKFAGKTINLSSSPRTTALIHLRYLGCRR